MTDPSARADPPVAAGVAVPPGGAVPAGLPGAADARPSGDLCDWLRGEWTITRRINENEGRFEGHARFTPDPNAPATLIWHEHGHLRLGGHQGTAERTLRIEPAAHGAWQVRFADGRPFHVLDLTAGSCEARHPCGADVYRGRYAVDGPDRFVVTWRVAGPRKDDVIESVYVRRTCR